MAGKVGSWVVSRRSTGEVIGEFFDRRNVDSFNPATCIVETAGEYLSRINREIAAEHRRRGGLTGTEWRQKEGI